VYVLILTDGSGSHPNSRAWPPERIAALRADETRQAMRALGVPEEHVGFVGLPDGRAPLRGARLRSTARLIAQHARERDVGTICTTWIGDPHRDHRAAYRIASLAAREIGARMFCYPVWGWMLPNTAWVEPTPEHAARVNIAPYLAAKRQAIACHRSQAGDLIADDPSAFRMSPEFLANFLRPYEVFIEIAAGGESAVHA
jgi:LmbE family N-acetylglucosaminyl deacetylase